jgi:hypothetical protein
MDEAEHKQLSPDISPIQEISLKRKFEETSVAELFEASNTFNQQYPYKFTFLKLVSNHGETKH